MFIFHSMLQLNNLIKGIKKTLLSALLSFVSTQKCFFLSVCIECSLKFPSLTSHLLFLKGKPAKWRDFHSATAVGTNMYIFGGRGKKVFIFCGVEFKGKPVPVNLFLPMEPVDN